MRRRTPRILFLAILISLVSPLLSKRLTDVVCLNCWVNGTTGVVAQSSGIASVYAREAPAPQSQDAGERVTMHQSCRLAPGSTVLISSIKGSLHADTSDSDLADVQVFTSARNGSAPEHAVTINCSQNALEIKGESQHDENGEHERIMLKMPRRVELTVKGVNGHVEVGEIDGSIKVSGVNGQVNVAQAEGFSEINGVNGHVELTIVRLADRGIRVSGVNGGVELKFNQQLNAELNATGINGQVKADVPNLTMVGQPTRSSFHARIGAGGAPIAVSGVNGNVNLALALSQL